MFTVYLGLGSNLGDRKEMLNRAINLIAEEIGPIKQESAIYETAPWGNTEQPAFLNQVVKIVTKLLPLEVLAQIDQIEKQLKRRKQQHWGTRTIDIDILFYENEIVNLDNLIIPHKYIAERNFVLVPLNEIASTLIHPVLKETINSLYQKCSDNLPISKYKN
ncbi:2-amino-4-hydroxy-6-hydroxymethyldihydropteridine diphosphokinase [Pseudoxanthomonas sp. SGD-10]|nr:2-amino-4-hydroxy-6-hydroxymethyldihydropteridine diphosphokinase [Pseudoxanthomonas sp. SGD-10]